MSEIKDQLLIRRVANGWVLTPGAHVAMNEFTHVAKTPDELAAHVAAWAKAQEI